MIKKKYRIVTRQGHVYIVSARSEAEAMNAYAFVVSVERID